MGALTIAFDTTIVGALALPWVYLVVHLFFSEGENFIVKALAWVKEKGAQVPAGVLLFAMTYSLGSAVSRIAQDFFNDDDLHFKIGPPLFNPQRFRVGVTEEPPPDSRLLRGRRPGPAACGSEKYTDLHHRRFSGQEIFGRGM